MQELIDHLDGERVNIVDVGAMMLGAEVYAPLVQKDIAKVFGFECVVAECERLNATLPPFHKYLPFAVGDGTRRTLHVTKASMCTSLYEPNLELARLFQTLESVLEVSHTEEVQTYRLDDIDELATPDFLKLDVQGAELDVLRGAEHRALKSVLAIHTEVEFVPLYKGQPLFGDVDQYLRAQGFSFHKFTGVAGRALKPYVPKNNPNAMMSQMLWGDAVYVRDYTRLETQSPKQLLKLAIVMHDCYRSFDVAFHVLRAYDEQEKTNLANRYYQSTAPLVG